jgi:hypothetical protein
LAGAPSSISKLEERMESATRYFERIQNRPELPPHYFVGAAGLPDLIGGEKQSHRIRLPALQVEPQNFRKRTGIGNGFVLARLLVVWILPYDADRPESA